MSENLIEIAPFDFQKQLLNWIELKKKNNFQAHNQDIPKQGMCRSQCGTPAVITHSLILIEPMRTPEAGPLVSFQALMLNSLLLVLQPA